MNQAKRRNMIVILLVVVLVAIAVYQNIQQKEIAASLPEEEAPKIDFLAPSFTLDSLEGEKYHVGGKRDKPLMLNFWASWCKPCNQEAPDLVNLYKKYGDQFDLYAINITPGDSMKNIRAFVEKFQYPFPVLMDMKGEVTDLYQILPIPTSFLIDTDGVIRDIFFMETPTSLERKIKNIIAQSK